ncbi:hypothetical protein GF312_07045 [Candidatus Poribacteria bacterium]|nr:hypothetical protein [Candidatus Poribacteria bacterium]
MDQKIISEYLNKSYFTIDGLWFMMLEEEFGFEKALDIDEKVWKVLPKIQARKVKEILGIDGKGLEDFSRAISVKLEAEGYIYNLEKENPNSLKIIIKQCPWYEILKKAKREHLAPEISDRICMLEFRVWLGEFDKEVDFHMPFRQCMGQKNCIIVFYKK